MYTMTKRPRRSTQCFVAALGVVGLAMARNAAASTIRDDTPDSDYTSLSAQSQYAAEGVIDVITSTEDVLGSGTLVAPDWVLTAAHVVTENEMGPAFPASEVSFGQGAVTTEFTAQPDSISQVVVESGYDGNGSSQGNDLALVQLSAPITNVAPATILPLSMEGMELGQVATMVGYGETGTGLTGAQSDSAGTRRAVQNVLDAFGDSFVTGGTPKHPVTYNYTPTGFDVSSNVVLSDFDDPHSTSLSRMGSDLPLPLEGSTAPGDSGGGVFITLDGQTYLAANTEFGLTVTGATPESKYGEVDGYTRLATPMSTDFIDQTLVSDSSWNQSGGGTWASIANWSGNQIPEYMTATANFGDAITAPSTVTLDANWTAGVVNFDSANSYTIAPGNGGTLTLNNGSAAASIVDSGGAHFITAPIVLSSNLQVNVVNAVDSITLSGNISGSGGIATSGSGTVTLGGSNSYSGPTAATSGTLIVASPAALPASGTLTIGSSQGVATVQLASGGGLFEQAALSVSPGSTLDLTNNALVINYATGPSPVSTIQSLLASAYDKGAWDGTGITSSTAAAGGGVFSIGYADGSIDAGTPALPGQVLIEYTLAGDANLDGTVNLTDLLSLLNSYGETGQDWADGDFNYDGSVNLSDLLILLNNYGQSTSVGATGLSASSVSAVPEPQVLGIFLVSGLGLLSRRRRPA